MTASLAQSDWRDIVYLAKRYFQLRDALNTPGLIIDDEADLFTLIMIDDAYRIADLSAVTMDQLVAKALVIHQEVDDDGWPADPLISSLVRDLERLAAEDAAPPAA